MKKVAIIGAGYLQLPIYIKAIEKDIQAIGFAWEEGAVAKSYCKKFYPVSIIEKEKILQICQEEKIDGILTIASDVAVPTVNYVASQMGLIGNSLKSSTFSTNKFPMRKKLQQAGINCPFYQLINSIDDLFLIENHLKYPCIVKPTDRSGSAGVEKLTSKNGLEKAVKKAIEASFCGQAIIEDFIEGQEISVETISFNGKHYPLAITDKTTSGAPHFVEIAHHQPSQLQNNIQTQIKQLVLKSLNALKIQYGASHSEFIVNLDGIYVTEIGARMGGDFIGSDLVYLSTGYDFLSGVLDVALGLFTTPFINSKNHSGVYFYSSETPMVKAFIANNKNQDFIIRQEINEGSLKPLTQSADRQGYFIYQNNKKITL
jgi:biotin carboxylase